MMTFRSCFDLFEMFFEVKKSSFSRFFSQIAPLSSLEEAVKPEVFHSQSFKQTNQNSFLMNMPTNMPTNMPARRWLKNQVICATTS